MNCDAAKTACHAAIDGELSPADRASLTLHCQSCPACAAYVRDMEVLCGSLRDLRIETEAIGRPSATMATSSTRSAVPPWLRHTGRIAAAIALLFGAGLVVRQFGDRQPVAVVENTTPQTSPMLATPDVQIALAGDSADRYIAVEQKVATPTVHVYVMYEQP
ncbi:MAG: zf-HC2 domain-containing protein [Phycisphaerales bacterium]|nr:zf-HC2 domain-containing protein [Phycisphaerales bacterium]